MSDVESLENQPENHAHVAVRQHNRKIVEQYMHTRGEARLKRHLLFTEDGVGGLWTTDSGQPIAIRGREKLGEHAVWSLQCFPDWVWTDIQIFETQDPNWFWVECRGEGAIIFPGYPQGHYRNHFLHSFRFENGLIKEQREFMNPCEQFRSLGIEVPEVRRDGLPS
ncbi:phenazine biosynthesis protein [Burkholderia cepacia]|uniref:Phenazine biosynthesis protein n=1 Tax=Burkholderia cepacia TaxID=292 RepID=A0A104A0E2_BURCE|nr:phenazine biosynthesis protein [Burkholderia cepacia]KVK89349.1 phenazine biosynthesis protein [Burkholderia cepacia]